MLKKLKNKFEQKIYRQLKKSKVEFSYETAKIPYVLSGTYWPDFICNTPLGKVYIECKGYLRPDHKRKMVACKRQHPELDIRLLFYAPVKSNIKWAERYGFKWAVGTIPQDWLHGY